MIYNIMETSNIDVWLQERIILHGENSTEFYAGYTVVLWTDLEGSYDQPLCKYICASNNSVDIDITDYVRTYRNVSTIYLGGSGFETEIVIDINVIGLINPASMIIPRHDATEDGAIIMPPQKMLYSAAAAVQNIFPKALFYAENTNVWTYSDLVSEDWQRATNGVYNVIDGLRFKKNGEIFTFRTTEIYACKRYAVLAWQSSVGIYNKQHIFYISGQQIGENDTFSLDKLDNELNATKGRDEDVSVYLDELSTYDIWYYSDILTSSNVSLIFVDGKELAQSIPVEVTTKSVTVPSGDRADGKIEFEIKIKRYDAFTM